VKAVGKLWTLFGLKTLASRAVSLSEKKLPKGVRTEALGVHQEYGINEYG
jgi:hypothetical protein